MNVYVWNECNRDYSHGLAVAIADTLEQAEELLQAKHREGLKGKARENARLILADLRVYPVASGLCFFEEGCD